MTLAAHGLSIVAMGSISNARAVYGLSASGTPTKTNVGGSATIGVSQAQESYTTADIAYSFTVTATSTPLDAVSLALDTGVVTVSGGSPTITDGDGNDFEGSTLGALVDIYAILIEATDTQTGNTIVITASEAFMPDFAMNLDGQRVLATFPGGLALSSDTLTAALSVTGQSIEVTVIGSTT